MSTSTLPANDVTQNHKEQAFIHRAHDLADYVGPIDMDEIQRSAEAAFERFVFKDGNTDGEKVSFEEYIAQGDGLDTIAVTAHPTFFKSKEESGLLAQLFTAYATNREEAAQELEAQISTIQTRHPYQDPQTNEEGEQLHEALERTIAAGRMMQIAQMKVAQKHFPDQWKEGRYSPFNRAIWHKFDRDGRDIPVNVQLGEALCQRRLGLELIYLPQLKALQEQEGFSDPTGSISRAIQRIKSTAKIYAGKELELASLDEENINMEELQVLIDSLNATKDERITHPDQIIDVLLPILEDENTPDDLFENTKLIVDNLQKNGLCFATPTHRVNAEDVHHYLNAERREAGKGDLNNPKQLSADKSHFKETEEMIEKATDQVSGSFTDVISKAPADGKCIHEMMMIRRFVNEAIDSHTVEKIDIAESHNAMTQRALRLAAKQYGISDITDIGLLHEDAGGIDNARKIYSKLLSSSQYLEEISHTVPGMNKKRPRLVLKIGYSDFAKQHSAPGGKPNNEKCLLQTMRAIEDAGLAHEIDLDIEFAGGEGPGRRVNPKGYGWTLKETATPAVLSFANENGIRLKYRETIQGGDGCILLGTEESAAKIMVTQLDHLSRYMTASPSTTWDPLYYSQLRENVSEHHESARKTYDELYNDPDFALLMKLHKELCEKGGSRKVNRGELRSPYDKDEGNQPPLADLRAIGFNAASIQTGVHLPPIFGQGTAFYQNPERTERLVQSPLFRERLITSFMVRDLHMMDELNDFVELWNPDYWLQSPKFDADGNETTESHIAQRLDELAYSDGNKESIYARLKRAVRLIDDDLQKFDQIRERYDFSDIESIIQQGNYLERLDQKRALLSDMHAHRLSTIKQLFLDLESSDLYSHDHTRKERQFAINAGICLDLKSASTVLPKAANGNTQKNIKSQSIPILDVNYNA